MASSLPFESLGQALLTIVAIMLFQVFLDHRRASRRSKRTDENFANVLAAISCLSSKYDQKQLHEKQCRLEIRSKLKNLQTDIDTVKSALRARPSENELFIQRHQKVLREIRELKSKIKKATSLPPVLLAASPTAPPVLSTAAIVAAPPPKQRTPEPPTSAPDQLGVLTMSDSEEEEDDEDMFAPGGDYNASAPWE